MKKIFRLIAAGIVLIMIAAAFMIGLRPGMDEVGIPYVASEASELSVKWLGVATLLIDDGTTQIMTDGFFSRPSELDILFKRPIEPDQKSIQSKLEELGVNRLAAIMPVHSHYDHAMDTGVVANLTGARVLGSLSTKYIALSSEVPESQITVVETGVKYQAGEFNITFYASRHSPQSPKLGISGTVDEKFELPTPFTTWKEGGAYAIHIEHPQGSILIQGSAGIVPDGLPKDIQADTVFLGVGGLKSQSIDYTRRYVKEYVHKINGVQRVVIIHHDDLFGSFGTVEQSKLMLSFDRSFANEFAYLASPIPVYQSRFAQAISVR